MTEIDNQKPWIDEEETIEMINTSLKVLRGANLICVDLMGANSKSIDVQIEVFPNFKED